MLSIHFIDTYCNNVSFSSFMEKNCQIHIFIWHSVQLSHSVVSDSLRPHELQLARPPCPSPTPRVHSDSRSSSPWFRPTISSSVVPFSSCPQSFPASGSFQMSQFFASCDQSIRVSASTSVLSMNTQDWSPERTEGCQIMLLKRRLS